MWFVVVPRTDIEKIYVLKGLLELCAQNMITTLNSRVNIIGENLYDHVMSTRSFTLIMNEIFI